MKRFILILLLAFCAAFGDHGTLSIPWTACNTAGKAVAVTQSPGDIVTLPLPGPNSRPNLVAFLVTSQGGNLLGKTLSVTLHIDAPIGTTYGVNTGVDILPARLMLYFTSVSGPFNFNNSDGKGQLSYWWNIPSAKTLDSLDDGVDVTLTATLSTAGGWTASHGQPSSTYTAAFNATASAVAEIGVALAGSHYADTGANSTPAGAILHVTNLTIQ